MSKTKNTPTKKKRHKKFVRLTEKELDDMKTEWIKRGEYHARRALRKDLATVLGLYEIFETTEDHY